MPEYSRLRIENTFDKIWEYWINKDGKRAAEKAVSNILKSDYTIEQLEKACEIYYLESHGQDPQFTTRLSNFINHDHWLDYLEADDNIIREKEAAKELIKEWNAACRPHWCKCESADAKIKLGIIALRDKEFQKNWKKSLTIAQKLFRLKPTENDPHRKLILSFKWFTNVSLKHTVLALLEGEYGKPTSDRIKKEKPVKQVTEQERNEVIKLSEEIFGKRKSKPKQEHAETRNDELAKQIREICDEKLGDNTLDF